MVIYRHVFAIATSISLLVGCDERRSHTTTAPLAKKSPAAPVKLPGSPDLPAAQLMRRSLANHGGDALFHRLTRGRMKMTVTGEFVDGFSGTLAVTDVFDGPSKFRRDIEGTFHGQPGSLTYIINDGVSSNHVRGKVETISFNKADTHSNLVLGLFQSMKSIAAGEQLTSGPELSSDGDYHIVQIHPDGDLENIVGSIEYHADSLLFSAHVKFAAGPNDGDLIELGTIWDDYRDFDGVIVPGRMTVYRGEDLQTQVAIDQYEFLDSVDQQLFAHPPGYK